MNIVIKYLKNLDFFFPFVYSAYHKDLGFKDILNAKLN